LKPLQLILLATCAALAAAPWASADSGTPAPADDVRLETTRLLKSDSARIAAMDKAAKPAAPLSSARDGILMNPYVIRESRERELAANETYIGRFLSDGTLYKSVGKTFTTRIFIHFYMTGQDGDAPPPILGNVPPVNGVKLEISFGW
jgi:hypothetical protein